MQGRKLLDTRNGNVLDVVLATVLKQFKVSLTESEDVTLDLIGCDELIFTLVSVRLGNESLESRSGEEVLNVGTSFRMTQQRLGEEVDQKAYGTLGAPDDAKRGSSWQGGAVDDGHVRVLVLTVSALGCGNLKGWSSQSCKNRSIRAPKSARDLDRRNREAG